MKAEGRPHRILSPNPLPVADSVKERNTGRIAD